MPALVTQNPTLLDMANASDPGGKIMVVAEILKEINEVLDDMTWMEGNLPTGHQSVVRTGYPKPTWRAIYGGVQPQKGTTVKVTDTTGMLEAFSEVDVALADLNGNTNAFRLLQDTAHIEGMSNEMADTLFYGDQDTEATAFTGLAPRFNLLSAESGDNILDAGGTGVDNHSIWLVVWSPTTVHGIIPRGSTAGLQIEDLGKIMLQDASDSANTGRMMAYVSHYRWDAGLVVTDWRFVVRIANIDRSLLTADASTGADLPDLLFQAMDLVPSLTKGRSVFYMNRRCRGFLRRQLAAATNMSTLTINNVGGKMVHEFQGIPVRRVDALNTDEARIV